MFSQNKVKFINIYVILQKERHIVLTVLTGMKV